jgi:LysM repeat protein
MRKLSITWLPLVAILMLVFSLGAFNSLGAASAAAQATALPLPEPDETGRVLYTVQPGDSPFLIAAKFQLDINQLNILNNWTSETVLQEGQVVILALASTPDPGATATPTPGADATPESAGTGTINVFLFDDVNGDGLRQETEFGIANGAVSVTHRAGLASRQETTFSLIDVDGLPVLNSFADLPAGEYTVSMAVPDGYNPTTILSKTVDLTAGGSVTLNFGAQLSSEARANQLSPEEGGRSPLMGLLGFVLLVSGLGLGYYNLQGRRRR